jgi:tetraacyldisaccharide 4'-kinase
VISVGNLSVGGSGKTPVVAWLARLLRDRGERPVILTRGYGRRDVTEGVLVVSDGVRVLEPVTRSGDEPQMLARALPGVPVLVCADRYMAGLVAQKQFGATVSILDDGFQHVRLARDVDLLLMSPGDLDDRVLPAGRLREPLSAAHVADAVLVPGTQDEVVRVATAVGQRDAFRIETHYGPITRRSGRVLADPPHTVLSDAPMAPPTRVLAFAGIARPQRFFEALRALGCDVARELSFGDHHWYTPRDLETIRAAARDAHAEHIVTTEKDAVRCDMDVWVLPISASIEPAAEFESWLMGRLH